MKFNKEKFLEYYENSGCNVSSACRSLNISRARLYQIKAKDDDFSQQMDDCREALVDEAENILFDKVRNGDTTALIFFLKTQGRQRGYGQTKDIKKREDPMGFRGILSW